VSRGDPPHITPLGEAAFRKMIATEHHVNEGDVEVKSVKIEGTSVRVKAVVRKPIEAVYLIVSAESGNGSPS
jgi:hypothetical protein